MNDSIPACPKCGGRRLTDNGGNDRHATHTAIHGIGHGLRHGSPLWLAGGLIAGGLRLLHPKRYTCLACGHVFKD